VRTMNIYISENIKKLRKEKGITQETLSEHLGISCQAISKWERGETFPDITMLIPISSYFGVSTDQLLGVDNVKNQEKIQQYLDQYDKLSYLGKDKEKCDLIRQAYKEFPNDWGIVYNHLMSLLYDPYIESSNQFPGIPTHIEEMKRLCNYILDECTNENFRYEALSLMIEIYKHQNEKEKAISIIERFPNGYWSKGVEYECYYESGSPDWWHWIRFNINDFSSRLISKFRNCAVYSQSSPKERIMQFQKAIDFINLLYENKDFGRNHSQLYDLYSHMSEIYIQLEDYENAKKHLDLSLYHAKQYDQLQEITTHTSFFVQGNTFNKSEVYYAYESNSLKMQLEYISATSVYNSVRNTDWFKEILGKYRPYASDSKEVASGGEI